MKKIIALIFLTLFYTSIVAQTVSLKFHNESIPNLLKQGQHSDKSVLLYISATWCQPCKEMENTTFKEEAVVDFFSNNYICKRIYLDKDLINPDTISIYYKNKTSSVPHFYVFDSSGKVVLTDASYMNSEEMLAFGRKGRETLSPQDEIEKMRINYQQNLNNRNFLSEYMSLLNLSGEKDQKTLNAYLKLVPREELYNETVIQNIINNETTIYGNGYKIISSDFGRAQASIIQSNSENGNLKIGYEMYLAALEIINDNAEKATKNNDANLLKDCVSEIMRVMQNKERAKYLADKYISYFEARNGKINR